MASVAGVGGAVLGGALIGLAASLLWALNGRRAGVSGIVGGLLQPVRGETEWQGAFLLGLVLAGLVGTLVAPSAFGSSPLTLGPLVLAGLLVGAGTRLSGGCTSGHGVCGISRGSRRSIVATVTFMASAVATVAVVRALGGVP